MDHAETSIGNQFGEEIAEKAIQHMMEKVEPSVRASLFNGLLNGSRASLFKIVELWQLNNTGY